ncbi:hypothetical protein Tco_0117455 [Tanacetum coccineum]
MAALAISISSDSSNESVGSFIPWVILFGSIPSKILVVPKISIEVPVAPEVGAAAVASRAGVLELDTHSSSESGPSEGLLPHVPIAPMRSRVASRSLLPTTSTSEIPTAPIPPAPSVIVATSTDIISPIDAPHEIRQRRTILIRPRQDISVGRLYRTYPGGPCRALTTRKLVRTLPSHRLALRSPATTVPSSILASGELVPTCADLLPHRKRFRDSILQKGSIEEDINADVLANIEADAAVVEIRDDIEDDDKGNAGPSDRGTIEVGVDVVAGIEILNEAKSLITGGERASLLDRVEALEKSNTRLQDTLRMESIMTITRSGMTPEAIEELINQRVAGDWLLMRQTMLLNWLLKVKARMEMLVTTEMVGEMETEMETEMVGEFETEIEEALGMKILIGMIEVLCLSPIMHYLGGMHTSEPLELCCICHVMKRAYEANEERFQKLTMLCTKMVPEEEDRVKKFIGGLPNNIQVNVIAAEPTRLQDAIWISNNLMDQKLKGYAAKSVENKRRLDFIQKDNRVQQPPYKRHNVGGQNVARAYTAGNNERRGCVGP